MGNKLISREQRLVLAAIATGIALMALVAVVTWKLVALLPAHHWLNTLGGTRMFGLLSLYAVPLLFFTNLMVIKRFADKGLIKAAYNKTYPVRAGTKTDKADIDQAVLQNTLEQTVITLPLVTGFIALSPPSWLVLLPVHLSIFIVGRLLFWIGYRINWYMRLPGFVMGNYSNLVLMGVCVYLIIRFLNTGT
ncbi:MAG: hypothetical protein CSA49_07725 [Gammaproteobacteria bacterium]|nr:MAG: hypothetical protein CSA49_07725 [Gammaproteobacteria bacterium]